MAKHVQNRAINLFRPLIVAALALSVLSMPLLSEAMERSQSSAQILEVSDSIAGLSTEVSIQSPKSSSYLELNLTQPNGHVVTLDAFAESKQFQLDIQKEHLYRAGTYSLEIRQVGKNEDFSDPVQFQVLPGQVSEEESQIKLSETSASLEESIKAQVKLSDEFGNPIRGHVLKAASSDPTVKIHTTDYATSEEGLMSFYLASSRATQATLQVMDTSTNKVLKNRASFSFSDPRQNDARGGNDQIILAAGPIAGFEISGLDDTVIAGDDQTINVRAIDTEGETVTDYAGEVRFASTDNEAELPNDYSFKVNDLGEHTFSLGVQFTSPGVQELFVNDTDNLFLQGSIEVTVVNAGDTNTGDDFVTDDFDRDGDFTLLSPASGSYSNDSIEVQGEADFGYFAIIYVNDEEAGRSEIDFENGFDFLLDDIEDGTYDIYVDVVDLGDGDFEDAEILEVIESSEVERVTIDTEAPELVSIESDPDGDVETQELVTITVLSERGMKNASIIFDGEIYALDETRTGGKYEAEILMPNEAGIYTIDVLLIDSLGNEVQYRDQVSLNVQSEADEESEENQNSENNSGSGNSNSNTSSDFSAPTGLIASPGVEKVQLSWEPVTGSGVSKYRIFYGPSTESLFAVAETTDSSTSWTIPELIGGQAHYFTVAAVDSSGNEGPQSTAVLGVPRTLEEGDEIPQGPNGPAINDVSQLPNQQPDSGAPLLPFAALSLMGAAGFTRLRRLA